MKKLLLTTGLLTALTISYSQIELRDIHGGPGLVNGTTITVNGLSSDYDVVVDIEAKNLGSSKTFKVKKKEIFTGVTGTKNAVCWGTCSIPVNYGANPIVDSDPLSLDQDSLGIFNGHVYPQNLFGQTKLRYVWFDANNPTDTAFVDVIFDVDDATSIGEIAKDIKLTVFPNPANTGTLNISLDENTISANPVVTITDLLGKVVFTRAIANKTTAINTSQFKSGAYFISVKTSTNAIKTKKIIVTN